MTKWLHVFFPYLWQDNEKKNILAVQTLRNTIMGSTLMATTSILLCSGLAAVISSTYSVKKPLNDTVYGAHGEFMVALKYVTLLTIFLFSFMCHSLSIRFINQVNILINSPQEPTSLVTPEYVSALLEKGYLLNTAGNRLFYAALPLVLWIFGPVLVFLCSATMVPVLYNLDFVSSSSTDKTKMDIGNENGNAFVWIGHSRPKWRWCVIQSRLKTLCKLNPRVVNTLSLPPLLHLPLFAVSSAVVCKRGRERREAIIRARERDGPLQKNLDYKLFYKSYTSVNLIKWSIIICLVWKAEWSINMFRLAMEITLDWLLA